MYRDIQEPMLNAAQEQFGSNPFQSSNNSGNAATQNAPAENAAPMPNPWGGGPAGSGSASTTQSGGTGTTTTGPNNSTGATLFSSPGMQSLFSQMQENPQLMQNMMSAPYTQAMFQTLSQNPEMASNIISSNPLFAGNPQLQEQMRNMMPMFLQQMQNPAVQGVMSNPEALAALNQIQQGLQRLQTAAPDLYRGMSFPSMGPGVNLFAGMNPAASSASSTSATGTASTTTTSAASSGTDTTTTTSSSTTAPTSAPAPGAPPAGQNQAFAQLMNQMVASMAGQGLNNPPEERFQSQLEQLASMGFVDRQANIQGTNGKLS